MGREALYVCNGEYDRKRAGDHDEEYWRRRSATLDFRGDLQIDPSADFALGITIYTAGHDVHGSKTDDITLKKVHVGAKAWVCSNVILYNCVIGKGAIVGIGSVVANRVVPPHVMVEGNPAMIVAIERPLSNRWVSLERPEPLERI